ncbi:MAG: DegT/DnrJ/EryC1/StrS aminotransferase family protein [Planctomycetes bacterium]|nr:DegT/DnrJ/EryC1/StrS aminotransferase family protein [Planctomycetota bacterium]
MTGIVNRAFKLIRNAGRPYQFGFVQGHAHLDLENLQVIKRVLEAGNEVDNKCIMANYETSFARLVGPGAGVSFASGRMAFYALMKVLGIGDGDEVILPGFTCAVMPNAIMRTGARPVYADIDKSTFGSDAKTIEKVISKRTKLIVAQHSFGIPCNIPNIIEIGKRHGIFVMEDCAITFDSSINGIKVGNWGDAAIFSTDHTKPLNTVIGGLLYTKEKNLYNKIRDFSDSLSQLDRDHQKRLFGQFMFERKFYTPERYPHAKVMNKLKTLVKKAPLSRGLFTFLEADYNRPRSVTSIVYPYPAKMPSFLAQLGLFELERWGNERQKRKKLLSDYLSVMNKSNLKSYLPKAYHDPALEIVPLRFAFTYPDAVSSMTKMARFIDIGGIWFRQPIICSPRGPEEFGYLKGSCSNAEEITSTIINWPCSRD